MPFFFNHLRPFLLPVVKSVTAAQSEMENSAKLIRCFEKNKKSHAGREESQIHKSSLSTVFKSKAEGRLQELLPVVANYTFII